jgi:Kef-type K+ transport system membrane component KefB
MVQLATLLLQIMVILATVRLVGWIFHRLHQPQVVGEMIAGILLGPSVLGWIAPHAEAVIFPDRSLGSLNAVSQVGLVLFLFVVGLEHDPRELKGHGATAVITSHASILVPFFLGSALALFLYPRLADDNITFTQFALFMGTAMSITAFPVLARILEETGLIHTSVGSTAIVCAAVDDVTGWLVVAGVLLLVHAAGVHLPLWFAVPATALYAVLMLVAAPRLLRKLAARCEPRGGPSHAVLSVVLLIAFASACATERLGIHPLFGAFLAGVAMPKDHGFAQAISKRLEDVTVVLLLPLFFAYSGLRTHIGLLSGGDVWLYFAAILAVAVVGKVGGAAIAARATGMRWREATSLGVLVNTRGLVELVVLNIGLDAGIISPSLFAIMVLMAITTTVMTTPLLDWVYPARLRRPEFA